MALVESVEHELRGHLILGGTNPDTMGFGDWLDAGLVFMTKDSSPDVRRCIMRLAEAESDDDVTKGFTLLSDTLEMERAAREKAEREYRRSTGTVALVPEETAEAAGDFFNDLRAGAIARKEAAAGEG